MNIITLDFETKYTQQFSLSKMTTQEYVLSPEFEVIMVGVQVNANVPQWFTGTMAQTQRWLQNFDWANSALLCQNTMFDAAILAWHFAIHPKVLLDTLCMSRALYPHEKSHKLAAQAERAGIGQKGTAVHDFKGYGRLDFSEAQMQSYAEYCINDVDLTYKLAMLYMPRVPMKELKLIDSTLRMYTEPAFEMDRAALEDHLQQLQLTKSMTLENVRSILNLSEDLTESDISKVLASNQKFATVLESYGVEPPMKLSPTTGKMTFAFAKTDEEFKALEDHPSEDVQALVAARLGTKSTIEETRTQRLIKCASLAREVPIALRYYGAWTGRWSADSSGATNFQNMPRKSRMKTAITAPKGYVIVGADLSNIELRLGLWLAGQWDKIELIRKGLDLYKDLASKTNNIGYDAIPDEMRQTFKVVNLSAIYQTGGARLQNTLRVMAKQKVPLARAKEMIDAYRAENDQVVRAWEDCHQALMCIAQGRPVPDLFRGLVKWDAKVQGFLLPSGLYLQLPNLRITVNDEGKKQFVFDGARSVEKTYGGKLFQGLTQAIARCIIAEGWLAVNKRYPVKLSVHDSLYWLAREEEAEESVLWGLQEMTKSLAWCPDLPLGAEGEYGPTLKGGSKKYKV